MVLIVAIAICLSTILLQKGTVIYAASSGHVNLLKLLMVIAKTQGKEGRTVLMDVASNPDPSSINTIKLLLSTGVDVNVKDDYGRTALTFAAQSGHIEVMRLLIDNGANVNTIDKCGTSALLFAIGRSDADPKIIELLIAAKADVNIKDRYGKTPLMWAIKCPKAKYIVEKLINAGADVNARDIYNKPVITMAKIYDQLEVVELLKVAGAKE